MPKSSGKSALGSWIIEPLTSASELDAVLAIEEASFTNPWTHDMYLAELKNAGVSYCYLAPRCGSPGRGLLHLLAGGG